MKKKTLLEIATLSSNLYLIMKNSELAKKVMYITAGMAAISKHKIEEMVQEFIAKSDMTEEEGKKFIEEITEKAKETKEDFEEKLEEVVKKVMERLHLDKKDETEALKKRIEQLEELLKKQTAK